jgi:hypothetical protein
MPEKLTTALAGAAEMSTDPTVNVLAPTEAVSVRIADVMRIPTVATESTTRNRAVPIRRRSSFERPVATFVRFIVYSSFLTRGLGIVVGSAVPRLERAKA